MPDGAHNEDIPWRGGGEGRSRGLLSFVFFGLTAFVYG